MSDLIEILTLCAIILSYFSVLWTLATRDRHKTMRLLELVVKLLRENGNGDDQKSNKKGGDTL